MAGRNQKPKKRMNPKSLENLKQNKSVKVKRTANKIKKEILDEVEIDEHLLSVLIPADNVFKGNEKETFMTQFKYHILEFKKTGEEPTVDDVEDIADICMNNILKQRFVKGATDIESLQEVMPSIEKLNKGTSGLKSQLASVRSMRIDPKAKQSITLLDLLEHVETRDSERRSKIMKMQEEEEAATGYVTSVEDMIK